jgi:hypothetical protein
MALARKPYVIIDAEILSSSIWSAEAHVRLIWITLLILCDTDGYVGASVPGIARAAGVSLEQAEEAMALLQEPDPHSRTKDHEGRRLSQDERGWRILNFREHLDRLSVERAKSRERVRQHRIRKRELGVTETSVCVTETLQYAQGIGSRDVGSRDVGKERPTAAPSWSNRAVDLWRCYFGPGSGNPGAIGRGLKPLIAANGEQLVLSAWLCYLERTSHPSPSPADFNGHFADYLPGGPRYSSQIVRSRLPACPQIDDLGEDARGVEEVDDLSTPGEADALPSNLSDTTGFGKWGEVLEGIRKRVNSHTVATWFEPCAAVGIDPGGVLWVSVPNRRWLGWLDVGTHSGSLSSACRDAGVTDIRWVVGGGKQ